MKIITSVLLLFVIVCVCYNHQYVDARRCRSQGSLSRCVKKGSCQQSAVVIDNLCDSTSQECCMIGSDSTCKLLGGKCATRSDCPNNHYYPDICPGTSHIVCCVPSNIPLITPKLNKTSPLKTSTTKSHKWFKQEMSNNETTQLQKWLTVFENRVADVKELILTTITTSATQAVSNMCWPLSKASTKKPTVTQVSWGSFREHGQRCHAGVDMFTATPGVVVSIAHDGEVVAIIPKFTYCSQGWGVDAKGTPTPTSAVMVYYPDLGKTVNYGEIDSDKIQVHEGQRLQRGQVIGMASVCGMLHFELYHGRHTMYHSWIVPPSVRSSSSSLSTTSTTTTTIRSPLSDHNRCVVDYISYKPKELADPRLLLTSLEGRYCI